MNGCGCVDFSGGGGDRVGSRVGIGVDGRGGMVVAISEDEGGVEVFPLIVMLVAMVWWGWKYW